MEGLPKRVLHELGGFGLLAYQAVTSRYPLGENVYQRDWDVLIVLDACRVDAIRSVKKEYEYIEDINTIWSVGGTSKEWLDNTFVRSVADLVSKTAYVTGNPFSNQLAHRPINRMNYVYFNDTIACNAKLSEFLISNTPLPWCEFEYVDPVWEAAESERNNSSIPLPSLVTKRAIWAGRNVGADRLIVHYMQPHAPYFRYDRDYDELAEWEQNPLDALRNGMNKGRIWEAYIDNLRFVLDSVETLLDNIDAETVAISADHGELFDEWSMTGHGVGLPHPKLRKVPWVETSASDNRTIENSEHEEANEPDGDVASQLKELGYL